MRSCKVLDVVETIYEEEMEEEGEDAFSNPPLSPASSPLSSATSTPPSSTPPLYIIVDQWTRAAGYKPNVVIRLHAHCFFLHREPMTSRSHYLRRQIANSNDVSVCPPFNITVDTFLDVARFCYGWAPTLTPSNVAAVSAAAEWLEMDEDGGGGGGSLIRWTEEYFRQVIAGDEGNAVAVLRCCVGLLPAAREPVATMAARCLEVLASVAEEGILRDEWIAVLMKVPADLFVWIAESMARWSPHDHDCVYRIVDLYFDTQERKEIREEEKMAICGAIECSKLSHELRLHLVQNSRLPLRFILKGMFLSRHTTNAAAPQSVAGAGDAATLADLLQEDAAARQAAKLAVRIESLERDIAGLRRRLRWCDEKHAVMQRSATRAGSFRAAGVQPPMLDSGRGKQAARIGSLRRKLVDRFRSIFGI